MGVIDPTYIDMGGPPEPELDPARKPQKKEVRLAEADQALFDAAQSGDEGALATAFKKGANPNVTDAAGKMAIHYALEHGHKAVMKLMIENGADIAKAAKIIRDFVPEVPAPRSGEEGGRHTPFFGG